MQFTRSPLRTPARTARLNTTVPQFSPATPHREPVPFGAPLNRAQIAEVGGPRADPTSARPLQPLACSTRRLEYLKARSVFEPPSSDAGPREERQQAGPPAAADLSRRTNSETMSSEVFAASAADRTPSLPPATRSLHLVGGPAKRRNYGVSKCS